jgi:hypothetical protein
MGSALVMRNILSIAALLAGTLMLPHYAPLVRDGIAADVSATSDCCQTRGPVDATCSSKRVGTKDWILLHRPDGEIVHIRTDQIVFVTSAPAGAAKRAQSKIQLLNGFADVRESVEEVMQAIQTDASKQISTK